MSNQPEPRRSRRRAYVSLEKLQERAKAVSTVEEHDAFWGEGMEDDDDDSFKSEDLSDTGEDIVDSDFDNPEEKDGKDEDDADEKDGKDGSKSTKSKKASTAETALRAEERRNARRDRPNKYVDPALRRKTVNVQQQNKAKTSATSAASAATSGSASQKGSSVASSSSSWGAVIGGTRTSLRKSTKAASARAAEERAKRRVDEEARRKQKALRDAERTPTRPLTQAERMEEAKVTEVLNRDSLKDLLRMEEEKKRVVTPSKNETGPVISFRSRAGVSTVSLSKEVDVTEALFPQLDARARSATPNAQQPRAQSSKTDK